MYPTDFGVDEAVAEEEVAKEEDEEESVKPPKKKQRSDADKPNQGPVKDGKRRSCGRSKVGKLSKLLDMPVEIFCEVCHTMVKLFWVY
jgi:hypothetical protein